MLQIERRKIILNQLKKASSVTIPSLARACNVSEITIRRDLDELQERGMLIRTHGGATKSSAIHNLVSFEEKSTENKDKKVSVCRKAAEFIQENDSIYIDCGSTVYHLVQHITGKGPLKVVTNSLPIMSYLINYPHIKLYMIGGELDHKRQALYSTLVDECNFSYRVDKAFIGAAAVSLEHGLSANDEKEAHTTLKMARAANEVFLLADSSKMNKTAFMNYSELGLIDHLVTDEGVKQEFVNQCVELGIDIMISKRHPDISFIQKNNK
jgi:DeoR family fructose operon transcriptional repressor